MSRWTPPQPPWRTCSVKRCTQRCGGLPAEQREAVTLMDLVRLHGRGGGDADRGTTGNGAFSSPPWSPPARRPAAGGGMGWRHDLVEDRHLVARELPVEQRRTVRAAPAGVSGLRDRGRAGRTRTAARRGSGGWGGGTGGAALPRRGARESAPPLVPSADRDGSGGGRGGRTRRWSGGHAARCPGAPPVAIGAAAAEFRARQLPGGIAPGRPCPAPCGAPGCPRSPRAWASWPVRT